jgi:hypothetical protein
MWTPIPLSELGVPTVSKGSTTGSPTGSFWAEAHLGIRVDVLTTRGTCDLAVRIDEFSLTNEVRGCIPEGVAQLLFFVPRGFLDHISRILC